MEHLGKILPFYDRHLDVVILTHPHADHLTGLISVLKRYSVDLVLVNKTDYKTPETEEFWQTIKKKHLKTRSLTMGEVLKLGSLHLSCLWPPKGEVVSPSSNPNLASIVLRLTFGDFSALLTADAENVVQQQLILLGKMPPPTSVLKVPHQGAGDCCDKEFLKKLKPHLSIISVGRNRFGHPAPETLNLFKEERIKVLRTDRQGTIEVVSDGKSWWYNQRKR